LGASLTHIAQLARQTAHSESQSLTGKRRRLSAKVFVSEPAVSQASSFASLRMTAVVFGAICNKPPARGRAGGLLHISHDHFDLAATE
jgi:hypothetical protein